MTVAEAADFVKALEGAAQQGTGCLLVSDAQATRSGRVFFRDGKVYSVQVDGFRPKVGLRLHTGGMLSDEQYATLLEDENNNAYAPHLGLLAVERGLIAQDVLDAVLREILLSSIGAMFAWQAPTGKFKKNTATDLFNIPPVSVASIVKAVGKRHERWADLWETIAPGLPPESAYPTVVQPLGVAEEVSSEVAAVVGASTGARSLDDVAGECGLTRFETGHVLGHLVGTGVVVVNGHPDGDTAVARDHGTAESATTPTENSEDDGPVHDSDPVLHFAPDVLDVVTAIEDTSAELDEPSAFGAADDTLPDGMDLGTIPTDHIAHDIEPVGAALPADLPRYAEPVPPVGGPDQRTGPQSAAPADVPPPPPGAPVFVDASALDRAREQNAGPSDMPGVPLPPLPDFLPPPPPPLPVAEPQAVPAEPQTLPTEPQATAAAAEPPVEFVPESFDYDTPAAVDDVPFETSAGELVTVDPVIEPVEVDPVAIEVPVVEPEVAPEPQDPRIAALRHRLSEEARAAAQMVEAAEHALDRANTDYDSHSIAVNQMQETLASYERFLSDAQADHERLTNEVAAIEDDRTEVASTATELTSIATELAHAAESAATEVEQAREALRQAQEALAVAEAIYANAHETQVRKNEEIAAVNARLEDLETRAAQATDDLTETLERIESYSSELTEVREMCESVEQARHAADQLRASARQRVETAHRTFASKQERLDQLG